MRSSLLRLLPAVTVALSCSSAPTGGSPSGGNGGNGGNGAGGGSGGQSANLASDSLCGRRPGGVVSGKHILRFENTDARIRVQLARRPEGVGVGESVLYALDAFDTDIDGVIRCGEASTELEYENSHHNWADVAKAPLAGVRYELAMSYVDSATWTLTLVGYEVATGRIGLPETALIRTGGPVGCYACPSPARLIINEVLPHATRSFADEAGEYEAWVEIANISSDPIELGGWSLSNAFGDRRRFTFAAQLLPRNSYAVVFLDGEPEQGPLHTSFEWSPSGGELVLTDPQGTTDGGAVFEGVGPDRSLAFSWATGTYAAVPTPSPGAENPGMP